MRRFATLFCTILLLISALNAFAEYGPLQWEQSGVRIRQGYHIEWQRAAESDENGNVVYAWSDTRSGNRDVYAQLINSAGAKLWGDQGAAVVTMTGRQEDPAVIPTGSGDYVFIWNDFRNDIQKGDLYAQKLDANGNRLWNPDGVLLSTGDFDTPAVFRIVADGTGGAMVIWNDIRGGDEGNIYAIRVDSNGNIPSVWPTDGFPITIAPAGQKQITVDSDGSGGAIVAWMDNQDTGIQGRDIYAQKITINAVLAWSPNPLAVCTADNDQESPKLCPDGNNGVFIVWEDKRDDYNGDLYVQRLSSSGTKIFPELNGRLLIGGSSRQSEPRLVADGSNNTIVIWLDTVNDPGNLFNDIFTQKISPTGSFLWGTTGMPVCTESSDQTQARLDADVAGGAICVWMDERNGNETPNNNIFAQKIKSDGNSGWVDDGVSVCVMNGYQSFPLVRAFPNYSLVAWGDERSGSIGIYYQKLNSSNGSPALTPNGVTLIWGISGNADHPKLVATGQDKYFIIYQDLREGPKGYQVYVQIVDQLGNVYLEQDGRAICPNPTFTLQKGQEWLDACSDGSGGAIAVWEDHRDANTLGYQIYAQHLNPDGSLDWGTGGIRIAPYDSEQDKPLIVPDGQGGGIVAWSEVGLPNYDVRVRVAKITNEGAVPWTQEVFNTIFDDNLEDICSDGNGGAYIVVQTGEWPDFNLYTQHVDASGEINWSTPVCLAPLKQLNGRIVNLGSEGAIFVWEDQRNGEANKDLYAQKINPSGNISWAPDGIVITDAANDQAFVDLSLDNDNHVFVVWQDYRNGEDLNLYMQKIDFQGNRLFPITGKAFCQAEGYQANPHLISDESDGSYILWDDLRNPPYSDVYGSHLDANGDPSDETIQGWSAHWVTDGNIINNAFHHQYNAVLAHDDHQGIVTVWEDKRSSGKEEVVNLYTQRLNAYVVGIEPVSAPMSQPAEYKLYAPYPNPFNPDVKFRFDLKAPGTIRLSVCDIQGREIAVLRDGWQNSGNWEVSWRAEKLASGLYLIRLQAAGQQSLEKVLLVK